MIKHLYDIFAEKWYHGGSIFLYADPHFGDEDSYRLRFPKEFDCDDLDGVSKETKETANKVTVRHLDQMQIDNINKVCGKNDTLIILGDVGDVECIKKLKVGYKVLIMGNHDRGASNYKKTFLNVKYDNYCLYPGFEKEKDYARDRSHARKRLQNEYPDFRVLREDIMKGYDCSEIFVYDLENNLFDEVYEGTLQIGPKLFLSHEPVDFDYGLNIHGHNHGINPLGAYCEHIHVVPEMKDDYGNVIYDSYSFTTHEYNAIAEQMNYHPIKLKDIIELGILKNVLDIHRQTTGLRLKAKANKGGKRNG